MSEDKIEYAVRCANGETGIFPETLAAALRISADFDAAPTARCGPHSVVQRTVTAWATASQATSEGAK
mgnify:CR=1 FL=1